MDAIMRHGIDLPTTLAARKVIYGQSFNPQITLKSLSYFDEGDLSTLPATLKARIIAAVDSVDLDALPQLRIRSRNA